MELQFPGDDPECVSGDFGRLEINGSDVILPARSSTAAATASAPPAPSR